MSNGQGRRFDLHTLLAAGEEAPPIEAVNVLGATLAAEVDATHVSLLIANFSGAAANRLSHVTGFEARHAGHDERLESLALPGSAYERVLLTQQIEVADQNGARLRHRARRRDRDLGTITRSAPGRRDGRLPG